MRERPAVLLIHGGAGEAALHAPEDEYRRILSGILDDAYAILASDGTALDAVEAAVRALEDEPLFNAGRGAALNADGECRLDAAIMCGRSLAAGAVCDLSGVKNPVRLARHVLESAPPVMLSGDGAAAFARQLGLEFREPEYFRTPHRAAALVRALAERAAEPRVSSDQPRPDATGADHGTVGAVALDQSGALAAATSTGGLTAKSAGRIGDSPIIGAGTYADDQCAVSCTGDGEAFIRTVAAYALAARLRYGGQPLDRAAEAALQAVAALGGRGGIIAVDRDANVIIPYNTELMFRGQARGRLREVAITK
jgi:beta-aspartyl-peptidase (threonine type)